MIAVRVTLNRAWNARRPAGRHVISATAIAAQAIVRAEVDRARLNMIGLAHGRHDLPHARQPPAGPRSGIRPLPEGGEMGVSGHRRLPAASGTGGAAARIHPNPCPETARAGARHQPRAVRCGRPTGRSSKCLRMDVEGGAIARRTPTPWWPRCEGAWRGLRLPAAQHGRRMRRHVRELRTDRATHKPHYRSLSPREGRSADG